MSNKKIVSFALSFKAYICEAIQALNKQYTAWFIGLVFGCKSHQLMLQVEKKEVLDSRESVGLFQFNSFIQFGLHFIIS